VAFLRLKKRGLRGNLTALLSFVMEADSSATHTVGTKANRNMGYCETCFHREGDQTLGHVHRAPILKAHPQRCLEVVGRGLKHHDLVGPAWNRGWIGRSPTVLSSLYYSSVPESKALSHKVVLCRPAA